MQLDMPFQRQNCCEAHATEDLTHKIETTSSASSRLADFVDHELVAAGLPAETIVDGRRRCRSHPEHVIPWRAHPCAACIRAARGMFGPVVVQLQPEVV
jgi:hypothetical protein